MQRQTIKIGEHNFLCELYKNGTDIFNVSGDYVMFRNFGLTDMVVYDTDLYIVERSLIDKVQFPISEVIEQYSPSISKFNTNINTTTEHYNLYTKDSSGNFVHKVVKTDKMRVYHPTTMTNGIKLIIHVSNTINNIKVHYFCCCWNDMTTNSETEIRVNNDIYSEFVEFDIPNIEDLMNSSTYFIENTNVVDIEAATARYNNLCELTTDGTQYCSMYLFNMPFKIVGGSRVYLPETKKTIETNYISYPVNITLYPYVGVNDDIYQPNIDLQANSDVFVAAPSISITSRLGFANKGKLYLLTAFNYPNKELFSSVREAYEYYNSVDLDDYNGIILSEEDEGYIEGQETAQHQCVAQIKVASDAEFKHIIYEEYKDIMDENGNSTVDDFGFPIPLFTSWGQMPEILICKASFIDRYLGTYIESNFVLVPRDKYKYLVNTSNNIYRLTPESMSANFDFIDKVTCTVVKASSQQVTQVNNNSPRVIYKPIFYKTQDLQKIQLKYGLTQNIGINLGQYLTKVDTFKLTIGEKQFIEMGRNDVYVIFKVKTNELNGDYGTYHISNQDDEYISSGNWTMED